MTAPLVRRFARNTAGRDLIVGDVHGHFTKLQAALDAVGFDPVRDRLFSVGDLVDRGPECDAALEWLARPWFFPVCGNHDDYAIRWPNGFMDAAIYLANGGAWNVANPPDASREFAEAFKALPVAIELETAAGLVGIVHAECPFDSWPDFIASLEDENVSRNMLGRIIDAAIWSRERAESQDTSIIAGIRALVVGHTPCDAVTTLGNVHYIDTKGWRDGRFTLLDAATLQPAAPAL